MNENEILFFLRYGYFPNYKSAYVPSKVDKISLDDKTYTELKELFNEIFTAVIKETVKSVPKDKLIIIPISGGLDSRAILAGVLKYAPPKRIRTYTFGIKGSYDFEIGKEVAKKAGVHHDAIELNSLRFTQEEMIKIAKKCDFQAILFHHPPLKILDELVGDNVIFSGYLGDLIFGSYADQNYLKFEEASDWYIDKKYYSNFFSFKKYNFSKYLIKLNKDSIVSPAEQLILYERGPKFTAPHILMDGWNYKVPLINKRIMDFMYSVPNKYRINEQLFIDAMIQYYPDLFNIRAKTTFGYHLKSPKIFHYYERLKNKIILELNIKLGFNLNYPSYNYIDFNKEIIKRPDLAKIFKTNLQDLENRGILGDIKPMKLYLLHQQRKNMYDILVILVSLEIILKAKEQCS